MNPVSLSPMETLGVLLVALLAVPIAIGVCLRAPRRVVTAFIVMLFMFSSSTWGQVDVENTIYSRGTGLLVFPLTALLLMTAGVAAVMRKLANPHNPALAVPLGRYFAAFGFLMLAHVVLGLMSGVDILDIVHNNGIINLFYMLIFIAMVVMAFNTEQDKRNLLLMFLALAAIRGIFGLGRYLLFDGDSANPYRNFESLDIKLFYFDIADNFVAALAAFCIAWLLTTPGIRLALWKRLALYGFLALEIAAVALSYRRSSLIGLALMFGLLFLLLPWRRRLLFATLAIVALSVAMSIFFESRLQFNTGNDGGFLSSLLYDVAPDRGIRNSRWYELSAAAQSIGGDWLFGLGSWGAYQGDLSSLDYHFGKLDFVHSGLGHLVLKTGVAGLALFLLMLASFIAFYLRNRKRLRGNSQLLADAGMAGFLFWIPTLLVGTPIIEFRTMLLIGLTLALPYVAAGAEPTRVRAYAMA
ncbi:O-antigen ligase family protein [Lacisediminimonas sp.]|uniref:O-antigen ligase family protein n=1 Tax=Lacisediminimonas sp. TaxID=3060582 RepID=UPI002715DB01|nr:O-antigen ligase family protein [Lacisediminimonas sp.]MDO8298944.1 O-antigen ligase family protein [Lacisediminimonas sp.]MDO9218017.1 O-antigen ligase family protein [Lacisediminimonas sp.]